MFFTLIVTWAATVSAFQTASRSYVARSAVLFAQEGELPGAVESTPMPAAPAPKKIQRKPAKWIPIGNVLAPAILDGTMAGDVGFDPLGFAKTKKGLYWMREAEIKHARLAMLGAAGWPLSELWHKQIASFFGLQSILADNDRAPSLLNGGLSNAWVTGMLMMSIIIAGILEGKAMNSGEIFWNSDKPDDYVPGKVGFDPLNLYNVRGNKMIMETAEIKNGRLAMIAITAFVFQEFATKLPVVQETPYLF
jgi:hypothetical protein